MPDGGEGGIDVEGEEELEKRAPALEVVILVLDEGDADADAEVDDAPRDTARRPKGKMNVSSTKSLGLTVGIAADAAALEPPLLGIAREAPALAQRCFANARVSAVMPF